MVFCGTCCQFFSSKDWDVVLTHSHHIHTVQRTWDGLKEMDMVRRSFTINHVIGSWRSSETYALEVLHSSDVNWQFYVNMDSNLLNCFKCVVSGCLMNENTNYQQLEQERYGCPSCVPVMQFGWESQLYTCHLRGFFSGLDIHSVSCCVTFQHSKRLTWLY